MKVEIATATSLLLWQFHHVESRLSSSSRVLQPSAPIRWDDCLTMSGTECEEHILSTVDGDLANHPIPDLKIKYSPQRPPAVLADTYWMYGVPTNIFGETDCDLNGGASVFPFLWEASDGTNYTIPDVPCAGKDAVECCTAVKQSLVAQNIPLTNIHGQCFSCWVHQQPLEPKMNPVTGELVYVEHSWVNNKCIETEYTPEEIQANDAVVMSQLIDVRADIHALLVDPDGVVTCGDVVDLVHKVQLLGRAFPKAMTAMAGLFCGQCGGEATEEIFLTTEQHTALQSIRGELANPIASDENCIIIYTDAQGEQVLKVPVVGGSRNDKPETAGDRNIVDPIEGMQCPPGQQPNGKGGCMCLAVSDMSGNEIYWTGGLRDTSGAGCECPPGMVEYNSQCFCPGGYKIWDAALMNCVCPHGVEEDGSCICPDPFSGLDWNNVGWVKSVHGDSCRVDYGCTKSGYDYYSTFEDGCDSCRYGYKDDGEGNCVKDCNADKGFVYDPVTDDCACQYQGQVVYNGQCECETTYAYVPAGKSLCECPPGEEPWYFSDYQPPVCRKPVPDEYYYYYNYKHNYY